MLKNELSEILYLQKRVAHFRDEKAYKELFLHFYTPLHRFVLGIIKDIEFAEDIVSESLTTLWIMEEKIAQVERLDYYLFRCVRNAVFAHNKKRKIEGLNVEDATLTAASLYSADTNLNLKETSQAIECVVQSLPSQCQMVFRLAKDEGMSYKEIESILEISENTIKTHMRIALKRIRSGLKKYYNINVKE